MDGDMNDRRHMGLGASGGGSRKRVRLTAPAIRLSQPLLPLSVGNAQIAGALGINAACPRLASDRNSLSRER